MRPAMSSVGTFAVPIAVTWTATRTPPASTTIFCSAWTTIPWSTPGLCHALHVRLSERCGEAGRRWSSVSQMGTGICAVRRAVFTKAIRSWKTGIASNLRRKQSAIDGESLGSHIINFPPWREQAAPAWGLVFPLTFRRAPWKM